MRTVLVTGSAGFIGFHLSQLLLEEGFRVVGYDGMTDYYDVRIKQRRRIVDQPLRQKAQFLPPADAEGGPGVEQGGGQQALADAQGRGGPGSHGRWGAGRGGNGGARAG